MTCALSPAGSGGCLAVHCSLLRQAVQVSVRHPRLAACAGEAGACGQSALQ